MNEATPIMNDPEVNAVRDARMAWVTARPALAWSLTTAGLCLLLALLGAVNSYGVPLPWRLAFWGSLFAVAFVFAIGIEAALMRAKLQRIPLWRWWAIFSLLLALAMTPVAYVANSLGGWAPLSMMVQHLANSMIISAAFVGVRIGLGRMLWKTDAGGEAQAASLLERLPAGLRASRLDAIEAEGHYVRVHTDLGSELVLMRLKDAIRETGDVAGQQVHRGWWVARHAVQGHESGKGRIDLLVGDKRVPVSRSYRTALRKDGWLD